MTPLASDPGSTPRSTGYWRYAELGGHRFHGWTTTDEPRNYHGPLIWSEADCVCRFALELEKAFPRQVHCELKVNKNTRVDFPDGEEGVSLESRDPHPFLCVGQSLMGR